MISSSNYPVFRVDSFSVSNFNPSLPKSFATEWEVNVTVRNPNSGLKVSFDDIKSKVHYREDILFSDLLASTSSHPFSMETNTRTVMQSKLSANRTDIAMMRKSILDKMLMDKKNGMVSFNLRFDIRATFDHDQKGDWLFSRHTTKDLNVECNDIKVGFVNGVSSYGNALSRDRLNGPLFCEVNEVDGDAF
ncbi:unnamed protein product [Dovyalis caffra]|uniref:Late embryogenesis abundant protein LEA-2 subgroup domain-containing protein n=1 Tax=Dovyalis caffra TaxID=77055 RepID=A0AAV1SUH5_9ROSI|nr:unnamed protein product [Dovyalis caffra]